jgi:hypothetical protein
MERILSKNPAVARPETTRDTGYAFEYDVTEHHPDGSTTKGRIDLYKRACLVLKSKQFQAAKAAASQLELAAQEAGVIEKKNYSIEGAGDRHGTGPAFRAGEGGGRG